MTSLILRTATQFLLPLLLLFSVFLLVRGHNEPGGGFVGGLMAAAAVVLYAIAYDAESARRILRLEPHLLLAVGFGAVLISGFAMPLSGKPFLTAAWTSVRIRGIGELHIGTPLLFDLGVYFAVIGATLLVILSLLEE
jgi:multicomponent Na+:H+ antiporter subunit B